MVVMEIAGLVHDNALQMVLIKGFHLLDGIPESLRNLSE